MKRINIAGLFLGIGVSAGLFAQKNEKPNIVFILADDLGWKDLGCTGSEYYETPNIDKIAQNGIRFTNAYSACSVSSPSRASILTGRYTPRHGITTWIGDRSGEAWRKWRDYTKLLPAEYARSLRLEEITIAERLKENGYTTFIAGKWHLGNESTLARQQGFDIVVGGVTQEASDGKGFFAPFNKDLPNAPKGEELSMSLAKETISFIKNNKNKPFFAFLSFYAPHAPIECTEKNWTYFRDKSEKQGIAPTAFKIDRTLPVRQVQDNPIYAGLIKQMDDAVGLVMDQLKTLGLLENTMVVFFSDNGGVSSGDNYSTSNLPMRGGKGRQWEGGIRVPLLIQYPGMNNKLKVVNTPVNGIDFFATFLDVANIDWKAEKQLDGVSLLPLIEGEKIEERPLFWHFPHYANQGGEPSSIIRDGDWKLISYHEDGRNELYNLAKDISEIETFNDQYPEKVIELRKKLDDWLIDVNAKMPETNTYYIAEKEKRYLRNCLRIMEAQEQARREHLTKGWKPNADWWGSSVLN